MLSKRELDRIRLYSYKCYNEGNKEELEKVDKYVSKVFKELDERSYLDRKISKRSNTDIVYVAENYKDENGIIKYYYSKEDIERICYDNKVVRDYVIEEKLWGERVEDIVKEMVKEYKEWFMYDKLSNKKASNLAYNMWLILEKLDKRDIEEEV